ncbi:MAG: ABC transporter ATP-binding protein [Chloroflexia bacterium]|nr:ABC transporter ATP-binding protein [Chloroflexia bacterium]
MAPQTSRLGILWSFTRPHWRAVAGGLMLALIGSATGLASPMVTKRVLDTLEGSASLSGPILALIGLLIVGSLISLWQWILLGTLAERIVFDARASMVRQFLGARVGEITSRPTGELVTRVTSDSLLLREAASSSFIGLINGTIMLIGSLILMGVLDLPLLGTTMVAVTIVVTLFVLLMPGIARAQEAAQGAVGRLGGSLEAALSAIRTVKASRAEDRQEERILDDARDSATHSIRAVRRTAVAWVIAWTGMQLAIVVILGFGAWRVSEGALPVSSLIAFLLYAFGLMGPITEISRNLTTLQSGLAAAGRIREVASIDQEATFLPSPVASGAPSLASAGAPIVELRDVSVSYGPELEPAVTDVSLAIPRRGHTAIVGPSGAGKTTLFSLMLRFIEPDSGQLLLDGQPYTSLTHHQIRRLLAYVEQETPVVPGTIRENLLFTHPEATDDEIWAALREVMLDEMVLALPLGLDTSLVTSEVSGGQRQRIALARAILRTPALLLLDEATAQLDGITEVAIQRCIRDRAARGAVVTIAHRLSTVIDADRIIVMDGGRIRAEGSHRELLETDSLYRGLVEALRIADRQPAMDAMVAG